MLVSAWNALTTETIVNCFHKAGISAENQDAAIAEEDDPFKELQDEMYALRTVQPDHIPEDINAASLVDVDAEVSAVQPPPTDADILDDFWRLIILAMASKLMIAMMLKMYRWNAWEK